MLNQHVDQFCDLSGFDDEKAAPLIFAHDSSEVTLVEIRGVRTILSEEEFADRMHGVFASEIAESLRRPGHNVSISFESSYNTEALVRKHIDPQRENAALKELHVDAILEESRAVVMKRARFERVIMALWTRPQAAPRDIGAQRKANADALASMPPMRSAMNPFLHLEGLDGPHRAFVRGVIASLDRCGIEAEIISPTKDGARPDIAAIKQGLFFHETPDEWSPYGPGALSYPLMKGTYDSDVSGAFAPPLAQQVLPSAASLLPGHRRIAWGSRTFGVALVQRFPKHLRPFNRLIAILKGGNFPFRVTVHMEGLIHADRRMLQVREAFATIFGLFNGTTKRLGQNLRMITDAMADDSEAVVKANIVAATWVEPNEALDLLPSRQSALGSGLQSWGECSVTDTPPNPIRVLAETVAGMTTTSRTWNGTLAPVRDLSVMLPFHRPAPVFETGDSLFTTVDGQLMPHRAFAQELPAWLTLASAGTGSGKSVLANRMNFDFAAYRAGAELPFLMVADVGVSSAGCMHLLRELLPPERRSEVTYMRPKNTKENAVNPFDISLGSRIPLDRERHFLENFLLTALDAEKVEMLPQIISRVVPRLYESKSDLSINGTPNRWQHTLDPELNEAAEEAGIPLNAKSKYWTLCDEFMRRGNHVMAQRAQRYAMPRLKDIATVLADPQMTKDFNKDNLERVQRHLEGVESKYPMFSYPTAMDLGAARIVSVDLQDMVVTGSQLNRSNAVQNTLMFLITRQIFMAKIAGDHDDIRAMSFPQNEELRKIYENYWTRTFQTIKETPKRLMMDEYHLTGSIDTINQVVWHDCRTGRKWNLEVFLVSQEITDFQGLTSQATTIFILNSDSKAARHAVLNELGGSQAVEDALVRYVNGPDKSDPSRGANVLAMYKLRNDEKRWVIFNNALGIRLLWALSTKAEDRAVRDELYKRVPFNRALDMLGRRFSEGTALKRWTEMARSMRRGEEKSIAALIVDEIMRTDMQEPAAA